MADQTLDPGSPGLMMRNCIFQEEGKYLILTHLPEAFCGREYEIQEGHKDPSDKPPPTYQYVIDGRIESHIVDPEIPTLKDGAVTAGSVEMPSSRPSDNVWEVWRQQRTDRDRSRSPHNIFASNNSDNRISREVHNAQEESVFKMYRS